MTHPVGFWATGAAMFRYIGIFACDYFGPLFYLRSYPQYASYFMIAFPSLVLAGGFLSGIIGGILSDRVGNKKPMTKTLVCVIGNLLAMPMFITAVSLRGKLFWPSLSLIFLRYLCGEVWKAPNLTLI